MTLQQSLEQIRERLKNATPGPWVVPAYDKAAPVLKRIAQVEMTIHFRTQVTPDSFGDIPMAEIIAHAPDDLARLVEALTVADAALEAISLKIVNPISMTDAKQLLASVERRSDETREQIARIMGSGE